MVVLDYFPGILKMPGKWSIKPIIVKLAPKLNAYLKSIGNIPDKTTDN